MLPTLAGPAHHTVAGGVNTCLPVDLKHTDPAHALCAEGRAQRCPSATLQAEHPRAFIRGINIAIFGGGHTVNYTAIHPGKLADMGQALSLIHI